MAETRSSNVTLPSEMADLVTAKVTAGEYANASEVVSEALRSLATQDAIVEDWLRTEVAATYDASSRDPSRTRTASATLARLEQHFATNRDEPPKA